MALYWALYLTCDSSKPVNGKTSPYKTVAIKLASCSVQAVFGALVTLTLKLAVLPWYVIVTVSSLITLKTVPLAGFAV